MLCIDEGFNQGFLILFFKAKVNNAVILLSRNYLLYCIYCNITFMLVRMFPLY